MSKHLYFFAGALLALAAPGRAQEPEDRTLLSWAQMRAIISTLPDEKAIVDVVAYINTLK